jgi:hypothetical protein
MAIKQAERSAISQRLVGVAEVSDSVSIPWQTPLAW